MRWREPDEVVCRLTGHWKPYKCQKWFRIEEFHCSNGRSAAFFAAFYIYNIEQKQKKNEEQKKKKQFILAVEAFFCSRLIYSKDILTSQPSL